MINHRIVQRRCNTSNARSGKPNSDWNRYGLAAYNIIVVRQKKAELLVLMTYLKLPVPSQPAIVTFKDTKRQTNAPDEATRKLSHFLDLALNHTARHKAAVENFTAKLLEKLEHDSVGRLLFFRRSIPFYISGVGSVARDSAVGTASNAQYRGHGVSDYCSSHCCLRCEQQTSSARYPSYSL